MSKPAAKLGDQVVGQCVHLIQPPPISGPVPVPHPFAGQLNLELSTDVLIENKPAAKVGSKATNLPPHIPMAPGTFVRPPANQAEVIIGSLTVLINDKGAARAGDTALLCSDPVDLPNGTVVAVSTVLIGG